MHAFSAVGLVNCQRAVVRGLVGGLGRLCFYRRGGLGRVYPKRISKYASPPKGLLELHTVEDYLVGGIYAVDRDRKDTHSLENYAPGHGASFHSCA
jgi:hypothetical protein